MLLALFDIIGMLSTNLYIMMVACRNTVNIFKFIFLRGGFSIYSGWVTAATILMSPFCFNNSVLESRTFHLLMKNRLPLEFYTSPWQSNLQRCHLCYVERNPLYGGIYIWVIFAIRNNVEIYKSQ